MLLQILVIAIGFAGLYMLWTVALRAEKAGVLENVFKTVTRDNKPTLKSRVEALEKRVADLELREVAEQRRLDKRLAEVLEDEDKEEIRLG